MVKKDSKEPEKDQLVVIKAEAESKIQHQIDDGDEIAKLPVNSDIAVKQAQDKMSSWYDFTREVLLRIFSTNKMEQEFVWASSVIYRDPLDNFRRIDNYLNKLKSISKRLELYDDIAPKETTRMKTAFVSPNAKKVFVVHGRNSVLLNSMFDFLRAIGLDPIEWSHAIILTGKPTPTIQDIVMTAFKEAQATVVLLSGDDVAKLRTEFILPSDETYEKELTPQARPNVLFEAGMAMTGSQERTILVQVGQVRKFSDIQGLHITRLDDSAEQKMELINKLRSAGCDIPDPMTNRRWVTVGQFTDEYDNTSMKNTTMPKPSPLSNRKELIKAIAEGQIATIELIEANIYIKDNPTVSGIQNIGATMAARNALGRYESALNAINTEKLVAGTAYAGLINPLIILMQSGVASIESKSDLTLFRSRLEENVRETVKSIDELGQ